MGFHRGFVAKNKIEPDAPIWSSVVAGDGNIALSWTGPYGDYNITSYQVQYSTNNTTWTTPATNIIVYNGASAIITQLSTGLSYYFRVRAVVGGSLLGKWGTTVNTTKFGRFPTAPTSITISSNSSATGNIVVSHTGANGNGYSITNYALQYSTNGGATWELYSRPVSANTVTAFLPPQFGLTYVFRAAAINGLGQGPYSATSPSAYASAAPTTPTNFTLIGGDRFVQAYWSAADSRGAGQVTYTISYSVSGGAFQTTTTTSTEWYVTVRNNTSAEIRVSASNSKGTSSPTALKIEYARFPFAPAPTYVRKEPPVGSYRIDWFGCDCAAFDRTELIYANNNTIETTQYSPNGDYGLGYYYNWLGASVGFTNYYRVRTWNTDGDYVDSATTSYTV